MTAVASNPFVVGTRLRRLLRNDRPARQTSPAMKTLDRPGARPGDRLRCVEGERGERDDSQVSTGQTRPDACRSAGDPWGAAGAIRRWLRHGDGLIVERRGAGLSNSLKVPTLSHERARCREQLRTHKWVSYSDGHDEITDARCFNVSTMRIGNRVYRPLKPVMSRMRPSTTNRVWPVRRANPDSSWAVSTVKAACRKVVDEPYRGKLLRPFGPLTGE